MVENKHGLGSTLSFGAKSVNPEILEALLIGRERIVNQLENRVKNIANDGLNHQVLIVGARGTGKTHLLSVLHHRIQPFINNGKIKVAYFAEEEYGISGFLDFLVRILNAFIKYNEQDAEFLKEQLTLLQDTPFQYQEETIQKIIKDYIAEKPLIILTENFNDILEALKHDGQSKLRNWLQKNDRISIISTAQALSDDIGKEDKPFYGFFDEINLTNLDLDQSYKLLMTLAELDQRDDVIEHLKNKGKAQVKAINRLVKGNHRLLITFYQFLKSDILSDLSVMFIKTLNDLKPYYETYIRYLPPQQQKILRFIALAKTPQLGTTIARECFIEQKSLSKQLSELTRKKLIEAIINHSDKRNKLYDVAEPLLRISIEIGEHKEGISALFVDFLALYYDQKELELQKEKFNDIYIKCLNVEDKKRYGFEVSAREKAIEIQNNSQNDEYSAVYKLLEEEKYQEVLQSLSAIDPESKEIETLLIKSLTYSRQEQYSSSKKAISKILEIEPNLEVAWYFMAVLAKNTSDNVLELKAREEVVKINPQEAENWFDLGLTLSKNNRIDEAVNSFKESLKINPKSVSTLVELGGIYFEKSQFSIAETYLKESVKLDPENLIGILMLAIVYADKEDYNKSLDLFNVVLSKQDQINREFKLKLQLDFMIGLIYFRLNEIKLSIKYFLDSLENPLLTTDNFVFLINFVLQNDKHLTLARCLEIEKKIELYQTEKNILPLTMVKTFRKYVLENDKEALIELPKEQREFFQKEILDFRKDRLGKE
ncbi:MAG: tetratricopeptide repeat protein [Nonlabens sp.]